MDKPPEKSAWAWFEAFDRSLCINRYAAVSLWEQAAIKADPEAKELVQKIVGHLADLNDLCGHRLNQYQYNK